MDSFESQFRIYYATKHASVVNSTVRKPLSTDFENLIVQKYLAKTAITIDLLKMYKEVPQIAKTDEEWSFLSELLYQLLCYISFTGKSTESNEISYVQNGNEEIQMKLVRSTIDANGLYGTASLFRSSCQENIVMDYVDGVLVVRALKFIPKKTNCCVLRGEFICVLYLSF